MLVLSDPKEDEKIIEDVISENEELRKEHELFLAEMDFKRGLIEMRKKKAMTQKEVSAESGLSQQAVSRLETMHGGTVETLLRYLNAMGLKLTIVNEASK